MVETILGGWMHALSGCSRSSHLCLASRCWRELFSNSMDNDRNTKNIHPCLEDQHIMINQSNFINICWRTSLLIIITVRSFVCINGFLYQKPEGGGGG